MSVTAIILADGADSDGEAPALQEMEPGLARIEWQIEQLRTAGVRDIEVVVGARADDVIALVSGDNVEPIVNPAWRDGLAGGMRIGASAVPRGTRAALIVRVERPCSSGELAALLEARERTTADVVAGARADAPWTALLVSDVVLEVLRNVRDDAAIEVVLARFRRHEVAWGSSASAP